MRDPEPAPGRAEKGFRATVRYLVFGGLILAWLLTAVFAGGFIVKTKQWWQQGQRILSEPAILAAEIAAMRQAAARDIAKTDDPAYVERIREILPKEVAKLEAGSVERVRVLSEEKAETRKRIFRLMVATVVLASVAIDGSRFYRSWNRRPKAEAPGGTLPA